MKERNSIYGWGWKYYAMYIYEWNVYLKEIV